MSSSFQLHLSFTFSFVSLFEAETPSSCFGANIEICGKIWKKNYFAELYEREKHFLLLKLILNPEYVLMSRNRGTWRMPSEGTAAGLLPLGTRLELSAHLVWIFTQCCVQYFKLSQGRSSCSSLVYFWFVK